MSIFGRAEAGTKGTLQLVQRGTDKRIPVELVKQPSGEVLDPTELEGLHVMVSSKSGSGCATIPHTIEDKKLVVEVTADISQQLGLGVYTMTATGRIPDPAYADGYHDYEIVVDLCKVTKYGSNETPVKVTANVLEGLKGEKGEKGEKGDTGERGERGLQGLQGERGLQGLQGERGLQGLQGERGERGEKGDSAYDSYRATTTDSTPMTEKQWANANDFFYQFLFIILKGAGVKPTETDMTADQVYELDRQRREIIEALRHHGVDINEGDGLSTVATKLAEIHAPVIVIHKEQQMLDWLIEESPTIKIYDGYSPASLRYTVGRCSKLRRIPDIIGASAVTDVSYICASCASMVSATLPDLPLVTTAGAAFSGCSSLTSLTIGDVPKCRTFSSLATGCAALQTLEIGNASSAEDISLIAVNCGSLTTVKVSFGNQVKNAQMAFFSCSALQRIDGELDLSSATNVSSTFGGCSSLEEVRIKGLKASLDLSACTKLSMDSVEYLVDNLQQVTGESITLASAWQTAHPTEARGYAQKATAKGFALTFR